MKIMWKKISINYSETHYYKLKFDIDIEVLRKCSPPYVGNSFEEFKSYVWSNIFYGIDTINVNQEWFDNNESILKETKMNEGHSMYDELYDLSEIQLSSTEEEKFTETQGLEEEFDSENLGKW
tara:strand:- start:116 stop:484 length:369 start_codon:yes stop_codon:yes gene_type:complete